MLKTEMRNSATKNIDTASTREIIKLIHNEDINAANAVTKALDSIEKACDVISEGMKKGGRLMYIGAGTSGRLGVLDASECPPTFGVDENVVIGIIAGGDRCLRSASEGAEDNAQKGREDIAAYSPSQNDTVVGISVAGGAAYVVSALEYAKEMGASTVALTSNNESPLSKVADITIFTDTGAEAITGSSRMKAGTSHKMVLNMLSTTAMIKQGYVYENLMINLKPSNEKLKKRTISIVCEITGENEATAIELLEKNDWNIRNAVDFHKKQKTGDKNEILR